MEFLLDIFLDALLDAVKALPFLFGAYLLIEFLEHKTQGKLTEKLRHMGPLGPLFGSLLGAVPQCGFSVTAANLYAGRLISLGTLMAVFISTSDEAVLILISNPEAIGTVLPLLLTKVAMGFIIGCAADLILGAFRKKKQQEEEAPFEEICKTCHCEDHSIWVAALIHTAKIFAFLFVVNFVLGLAFHFFDEETIGTWLLSGSFFQPFLTALFGFIPNCAVSVVLTELYMSGTLSFGSVVAGLATGAGLGMAVLFKTGKFKENIGILAALYVSAVLAGILLNLFI